MSNSANDMNATESMGPAGRLLADGEDLISLAEAASQLPRIDHKKVPISTVWRWVRYGLRGVYLEHVRIGRKVCTSHQALIRFFAELSTLDRKSPPPGQPGFTPKRRPISSRQRLRALREADAVLARAGI